MGTFQSPFKSHIKLNIAEVLKSTVLEWKFSQINNNRHGIVSVTDITQNMDVIDEAIVELIFFFSFFEYCDK